MSASSGVGVGVDQSYRTPASMQVDSIGEVVGQVYVVYSFNGGPICHEKAICAVTLRAFALLLVWVELAGIKDGAKDDWSRSVLSNPGVHAGRFDRRNSRAGIRSVYFQWGSN